MVKSGFFLGLFVYLAVASATITGSQSCNNYLCVLGTHDDQTKTDTYTLTPPTRKQISIDKFGWMAIGFGSTMANSPMVIVWPNADGSVTLSQREAPAEIAPSVVSNPPRKATLNTAKSFSNSSTTSLTFSIPSVSGATASSLNSTTLIWAYSSKNPGSSASSAPIRKHDGAGIMQIQLLQPLSSGKPSTTGSGSGSTAGTGGSGSRPNRQSTGVLLAHAICGVLATLVVLPIGIIIPRYARGISLNRWWFPAHATVNGIIGAVLVIVTYAIARSKFHKDGRGTDSSHRSLGVAVFALVLVQVALGIFVHWYKSSMIHLQTRSGRGPSNFLHMVMGVIIVIIGWVTTWKGMDEEWAVWGPSPVGKGYKAGFWVLVAIGAGLYAFGVIYFLPKQRRLEREAAVRYGGPAAGPKQSPSDGQGIEMGPGAPRKTEDGGF